MTTQASIVGAAGLAANAITNAKLAQMAQSTLKGRASGAGSGDPVDLTADQLVAIIAEAAAALTAIGGMVSGPTGTNTIGLLVNLPTGSSSAGVLINNVDNGSSGGPSVEIRMNTNATTPAAGFLRIYGKNFQANDIWPDSSAVPGVLRVGNATATATDLAGTVIGSQASALDQKDVIEEVTDYAAALQAIADTPLFRFYYKDGRFGNPEYLGIITDYAPLFGADPDEAHPNGRMLNEVNAHGYALAAIKALNQRVLDLETRLEKAGL